MFDGHGDKQMDLLDVAMKSRWDKHRARVESWWFLPILGYRIEKKNDKL